MVPRLKPTLVCPGPLLLSPAVTPAAEAGTTTSLAFPMHTSTHTCYLTVPSLPPHIHSAPQNPLQLPFLQQVLPDAPADSSPSFCIPEFILLP